MASRSRPRGPCHERPHRSLQALGQLRGVGMRALSGEAHPQQLSHDSRSLERIRDHALIEEGDRGDGDAVALGDQRGSGKRLLAVQLGELPQRGRVGFGGLADRPA
jgi:hypothetical protein